MKVKKNIYGLDFGTSNSAIAVLDDNSLSRVLEIGNNKEKIVKSVLFFPEDQDRSVFAGDDAIREYFNSGKKGRFMQSVKSLLSSKLFLGTVIEEFGRVGIETLISFMLKDIKNRADLILKEDVKRVVIGRPVQFSLDKETDTIAEKRLLVAAQRAGFEEIYFQFEPIAAALHYESKLTEEKLALVVDIGGGTSDFVVMKLSSAKSNLVDRSNDILSFHGVNVGGDNFDSLIMKNKLLHYFGRGSQLDLGGGRKLPFPNHILFKLCQWQDIDSMKNRALDKQLTRFYHESDNKQAILSLKSLINDDLGYGLFRKIEEAKMHLSNDESAVINFKESIINIEEKIARIEFEDIVRDELSKIDSALNESLLLANVNIDNIDAVFFTGGSSLVPSIRNIITKKFSKDKIVELDSFTSVTSGLALSTKLFF